MASYFDEHAELASEDDEDFEGDEEDQDRPRRSNGGDMDDSSEEEEDDDADALAEIQKDFVVSEEEEDPEERKRRRAERKKRKREERQEEEDNLEDEDLDLIAEANPEYAASHQAAKPQKSRFKRLKSRNERAAEEPEVEQDFWEDQEEEPRRGNDNEMDDFIEEDFPDPDAREQNDEDIEVTRIAQGGFQLLKERAGLDEDAMEDFQAAFGDGNDYNWALDLQEQEDYRRTDGENGEGAFKAMELKDVFEPSELERKYLTDADHEIRGRDEPERFQIGRKPYRNLELTESQVNEEAGWISKLLWPKVKLEDDLIAPFTAAIAKVLQFYNVEELEVPFVFRHRKDYLVHEPDSPAQESRDEQSDSKAVRLLTESDLWEIFQQDLRFRAFIERRNVLEASFNAMKEADPNLTDKEFETMLAQAETVDELQDLQDYLHFEHSARLSDAHASSTNGVKSTRKRPGGNRLAYDRVRNSSVHQLVKAFGISAEAFAQNVTRSFIPGSFAKQYTEDPSELPEVMAQNVISPPEFPTGPQCLRIARNMFAEELATSPRLRQVFRRVWYTAAVFDCVRTEKGLRKIDEQHPFYQFKYLRNQTLQDTAEDSGIFLRMLAAEADGLVEIQFRIKEPDAFKKDLIREIESDNVSDVADAWNKERREALSIAIDKIHRNMARGVKENVRSICENQVAQRCREAYYEKLDQAPWKPKGETPGTIARVLSISNGNGILGRDPLTYVMVDDDGRMLESSRLVDLSPANPERGIPDGADVAKFLELIDRRNPDVIAVSGYSMETQKLFKQIQRLAQDKNVRGPEYTDDDDVDGPMRRDPLDIIMVNDEVARLYKDSDRAQVEYPALTSLGRYCVALARYVQSPLHEYASLGRDIISINFDRDQRHLSEGRLLNALETAIVDVVNMVGVDINEAIGSAYHSSLLPYVSALGPRKAQHLIKAIRINGGGVVNRTDLIYNEEHKDNMTACGPKTFTNCASFLRIPWDMEVDDAEADFLDSTRVHPEDYELARKMAADALDLDEEDIEQEQNDHGPGAVVRRMVRDGSTDKIQDLYLGDYAHQLWEKFHQRKLAALNTIRSEIMAPYEELRREFDTRLDANDLFTMLTGETSETLAEGMIVPIVVKRLTDDSIEARLDCGLEAVVEPGEVSETNISPRQLFTPGQTIRAKVLHIDKRNWRVTLSVLEHQLRNPGKRDLKLMDDEWDKQQEKNDQQATQVKHDVTGRTQRVIKHPLFKPMSASQAEEYLGSQAIGSVVIRPSSKGTDHLVVTWKVADGVYKHIDVLELNKENEFSVGRTLKVDNYTYSDLDELIVNHVNAMSRKVDEMMAAEKFQRGSKADTDRWLTTYLEANPKRSTYAFCINTKNPGYFYLSFKESQKQPVREWHVKIIPGAFELRGVRYPDMRGLTNGFKLLYGNLANAQRRQ